MLTYIKVLKQADVKMIPMPIYRELAVEKIWVTLKNFLICSSTSHKLEEMNFLIAHLCGE